MATQITLALDDDRQAAAEWKCAQYNATKLRDDPQWQPLPLETFVVMMGAEQADAWRKEKIYADAQMSADAAVKAAGL